MPVRLRPNYSRRVVLWARTTEDCGRATEVSCRYQHQRPTQLWDWESLARMCPTMRLSCDLSWSQILRWAQPLLGYRITPVGLAQMFIEACFWAAEACK